MNFENILSSKAQVFDRGTFIANLNFSRDDFLF